MIAEANPSCDKSDQDVKLDVGTKPAKYRDMWAVIWFSLWSISFKGLMAQTLQISPNPAIIIQNGSLELTCIYEGSCGTLEWYRNGVSVLTLNYSDGQCITASSEPVADNYTCEPQGNCCNYTLSWNSVQLEQNGDVWKCELSGLESTETVVNVTVRITSVTMTSPAPSVSEGVGTQFVCLTSSGKPAATIQWYKKLFWLALIAITDNITTDRIDTSIDAATRSTLLFFPNRTDHLYQIYCKAYNDAQTMYTTSSNLLSVAYPCNAPSIQNTVNGSEYRIIDGRPQTLTCTAEGGSPLATLSWDCFNGNEQGSTSGTTATRNVSWTAAISQDGQLCTCQPSYNITSWKRQVYVQIKVLYPPSPPVITVNRQTVSGVVSVIEDGTVSINCSSTGVPSPAYTWSPRGTSVTDGVLTLSNVQISSNGTIYTCTATNIMDPSQGTKVVGTATKNFTVNVLYSPRNPRLRLASVNGQSITPQQQINVVRGDSFSIYCEFTSNPEPSTYQWTGQSGNILRVSRIQTDTSWTCTATNTMVPTRGGIVTRSSSVTITATVMYGPSSPSITYNFFARRRRSLQTQSELRVIERVPYIMICGESDSKPVASYSWSGAFSSATDILSMGRIGKQHNDRNVTCTARNVMKRTFGDTTNGVHQTSVKLVFLYPPTVHTLSNVSVVENQTFTKTCQVDPGYPPETQYQWTLNTVEINNQQTLSIQRVNRTHMGIYTCIAWNMINPTMLRIRRGEDTVTFWLNVLYGSSMPHFTINAQSNSQVTFEYSSTLTLRCHVDSNPGSTITFKKDNAIVHSVSNVLEAAYTMANVGCTDAGVYTCTAYNAYNGDSRPEIHHNVNIRSAPVAVEPKEDTTIYAAVNHNITLSQILCSYPFPSSYKWYKYDRTIGFTNVTTGITSNYPEYNLTFVDITPADFGLYQIIVDNGLGTTLGRQFSLVAQGPPEVPPSLDFDSVTLQYDSVIIKWTGGFNGGLEQTFYIQYRHISDTTWITLKVNDTGMTTLSKKLTGLSGGTVYTFRMFAGNSKGNSSTSEAMQFTTPANPSSESQNWSVIGITVGTISGLILIATITGLITMQRRYGSLRSCRRKERQVPVPAIYQNVAFRKDEVKGKSKQDSSESNQYESLAQRGVVSSRIYDALGSSTGDAPSSETVYENLRIA